MFQITKKLHLLITVCLNINLIMQFNSRITGLFQKLSFNALRKISTKDSCLDVVTLPLQSFKTFKLDVSFPTKIRIHQNLTLKMLRQMMFIRSMNMAASELFHEKLIRSMLHLNIGQEGVAVGMYEILDKCDDLIAGYRNHHFAICSGMDPVSLLGELTARTTGCNKGRGGSMHLHWDRLWGGEANINNQAPLGAGLALFKKLKHQKGASITVFGDGAANQGQLYEALNIAKIWNLPCIFVCENNKFAVSSRVEKLSGNPEFYTRGDYVPGIWIDGTCVLSVREGIRIAHQWSRSGKGPIIVEMNTYRLNSHNMNDKDENYRSEEEKQHFLKESDPVAKFTMQLLKNGITCSEELETMQKEIDTEINQAVIQVKNDQFPPISDVCEDIFKNYPINQTTGKPYLFRGCDNQIWWSSLEK